jgi:hypothetical protein
VVGEVLRSLDTTPFSLFGRKWTQLNYGWWTVLEPDLTDSYKKETTNSH